MSNIHRLSDHQHHSDSRHQGRGGMFAMNISGPRHNDNQPFLSKKLIREK